MPLLKLRKIRQRAHAGLDLVIGVVDQDFDAEETAALVDARVDEIYFADEFLVVEHRRADRHLLAFLEDLQQLRVEVELRENLVDVYDRPASFLEFLEG